MKIGIILSGNIESQPYLSYYTDVFDEMNIDYDYIGWDRDNENPQTYNNHKVISINVKGSIKNNNFRKIYDYWIFAKRVKEHLNKNNYDFLLVHTIVNAVFLKNYLLKKFSSKFIYDIRDYSPIYPFVKKSVKKLINKSLFTVVSSEGFLEWLPINSQIILSHNVAKNNLFVPVEEWKSLNKNSLKILTIGKIRDFYSNQRVICDLGNKNGLEMIFSGAGIESEKLKTFALENYNNVVFTGSYEKKNETDIVKPANMINIVLPINILSNTLISNRFYLAITHKKPIIVNEESFQSTFIEKYNLGLIVKSQENIYEKIEEYIDHFDYKSFNKGCEDLILIVKKDIEIFENTIKEKLIQNKK
ncbi:hypothetical protein GJU43_05640 [Flavobacterium sp. LC2016-23]|uniref:hypothetical protein n=1 Tax=Flavobacterium sp. LC2016-23 TaxID=2666330 RepID=UPI0012AF055D|nr:hypothetical protein [Flavobacterium sp. LC2016-23]MRX38747.1 hypothetical protein [Flavobacterium sp. LC2016-23]